MCETLIDNRRSFYGAKVTESEVLSLLPVETALPCFDAQDYDLVPKATDAKNTCRMPFYNDTRMRETLTGDINLIYGCDEQRGTAGSHGILARVQPGE